jgi:hypothetical protein
VAVGRGDGLEPQLHVHLTDLGSVRTATGQLRRREPFRQFELERVIDQWFAKADLSAEVEPLIGKCPDVLEDSRAKEHEPITDPRLPDLNYWSAVDLAVARHSSWS